MSSTKSLIITSLIIAPCALGYHQYSNVPRKPAFVPHSSGDSLPYGPPPPQVDTENDYGPYVPFYPTKEDPTKTGAMNDSSDQSHSIHNNANVQASHSQLSTKTYTSSTATFDDTADLSGEVLADKYLLLDDAQESTSGKSVLCQAYLRDEKTGEPIGEPLVVKQSTHVDALARESETYQIVDPEGSGDIFVELHDHLPPGSLDGTICSDTEESTAVLIMEKGKTDLKTFLNEQGPLQGEQLRHASHQAALCVQAFHSNSLVWTELKAENFVVQASDKYDEDMVTIKGIDLESAVGHKSKPIDFTPKACPPEFALPFLCGKEPTVEIDYSFDVWSLGMLLFKLATGNHYFSIDQQSCNIGIASTLRELTCDEQFTQELLATPEMQAAPEGLIDIVTSCLRIDPSQRPCIDDILEHSYFDGLL